MDKSIFNPLREIKTFQYAQEDISREGMQEISEYLASQFNVALPQDFDSRWIVTRGEYAGTFPKRVSSWLYKTYSLRALPEQISQIGNIARAHSGRNETYRFDFTDTFDWRDGDFGDSGSCYWGCHSEARKMLADNGSLAVRFYREDGTGYARAWIVFTTPNDKVKYVSGHKHARVGVMYNAYGIESVRIARIVATALGLSYKKIELMCNDETDGTLWINHNDPDNNNEGTQSKARNGSGYAIGDTASLDDLLAVDLQWESGDTCARCGTSIRDDNGYSANDEIYCESCYCDLFTSCARCNDAFDNDDVTEFGGDWYCERCLNRIAFVCADCGEWRDRDERQQVEGGDYVCERCLDRHYAQCQDCDKYASDENITTLADKRVVCDNCLSDYDVCRECCEYYPNDEIKKYQVEIASGADTGALVTRELCEACARDLSLPETNAAIEIDPAQLRMEFAQ